MSDVNTIVAKFSNILISAANKSLKKGKTRKEKTNTNKKWFDLDLIKMRKTLDHKGKLFAKYPTDPFVRGNFINIENLITSCVNLNVKSINQILSIN